MNTKTTLLLFLLIIIFMLLPAVAWSITLPSPPAIGGGSTSDVWDYFVTTLKTILGVVLVALIVGFVLTGGSGLMGALSKAKETGRWGDFFIYLGAMLFVGIILLFFVYYANEEFLQLI